VGEGGQFGGSSVDVGWCARAGVVGWAQGRGSGTVGEVRVWVGYPAPCLVGFSVVLCMLGVGCWDGGIKKGFYG